MNNYGKRGATREFGRFPVRERRQLAKLVRELIAHHGGSAWAAAPRLRISQPTLSRMLAERLGGISQDNAARLERAAHALKDGGQATRRLVKAIASREAYVLLRRGAVAWCAERRDRLVNRRGAYWHRPPGKQPEAVRQPFRQALRGRQIDQLMQRVANEYPKVVGDFLRFCQKRGVTDLRAEVAHVRVVEPLLEFKESGYIERRWEELTPSERKQFLTNGYRREKIMLRREHDLERAHRLVTGE